MRKENSSALKLPPDPVIIRRFHKSHRTEALAWGILTEPESPKSTTLSRVKRENSVTSPDLCGPWRSLCAEGESLFGHSFGAVVSCEQFQQMPIGISEVNAAATIPVVDFHVVGHERSAAIHQPFRLHATENIVEFGFPDLKGIVVWLERLAVVEVES